MRKFFLTLMVAAMAFTGMAADYQHSIGIVGGGLNGISYKGFISGNWAVQADLAVGLKVPVGSATTKVDGIASVTTDAASLNDGEGLWDFVFNPNLVYQSNITGGLDWFAGAGVSGGFSYMNSPLHTDVDYSNADPMGKFGINAIAGVEYKFSFPIAISLDFRPGYGMYARTYDGGSIVFNTFDWNLALGVRYCF